MKLFSMKTVYRLLLCLAVSPAGMLINTSPANAQLSPQGCNLAAPVPVPGYGGVGTTGSSHCWDLIDSSTIYVTTVNLWRRDTNGNWFKERTWSASCVAGNGLGCGNQSPTLFRELAPAGWYHTETKVVGLNGGHWLLNSGELAVGVK